MRSWTKRQPTTRRQRTQMYRKCGKPCFLGTRKSFPICNPDCSLNRGGLQSAFIRAREMQTRAHTRKNKKHPEQYYRRIAGRAKMMMYPNQNIPLTD